MANPGKPAGTNRAVTSVASAQKAAATSKTRTKPAAAAKKAPEKPGAAVAGHMDQAPDKAERTRQGGRRVKIAPMRGDRTTVDPSKIVRVPAAHALPGENEPLSYRPGRGKITQAEALGVLRRRQRATMKARTGIVDESEIESEFPSWALKKELATFRMAPALKALSEAMAEVEGVAWASFMEELVWERLKSPPRTPQEAAYAVRAMLRETVGEETLDRQFGGQ